MPGARFAGWLSGRQAAGQQERRLGQPSEPQQGAGCAEGSTRTFVTDAQILSHEYKNPEETEAPHDAKNLSHVSAHRACM